MTKFTPILERARKRAGGAEALEDQLPLLKGNDALRAFADDRYLSLMSQRAFRAGLRHALVDGKWPAFEEAFYGFDLHRVRAMSDEDLEHLMGEKRIIRHWGKIKAVRDNAAEMIAVAEENGSFGSYLADWPGDDVMGLWRELGRRFRQMGGNSGPYFLRMAGRDTFLLTDDVVRALVEAGVIAKKPTTRDDRAKVQAAFNAWVAETGRPMCQLSRILALSVG